MNSQEIKPCPWTSPRPWKIVGTYRDIIVGADGVKVCELYGDLRTQQQDAALIVDAVNERDRLRDELTRKAQNYEDVIAYHMRTEEGLRDIVRRLTEYADAVTGYRPPAIEVVSSEHPAWMFDGASLLREARSALGAGGTPTGKGVGE